MYQEAAIRNQTFLQFVEIVKPFFTKGMYGSFTLIHGKQTTIYTHILQTFLKITCLQFRPLYLDPEIVRQYVL